MSLAIQLKATVPTEQGIFTLEPKIETESITEICIKINYNLSCFFPPFYPHNKENAIYIIIPDETQ